ncbi:hypothetical protein QG37_04634 [Candidozyma auris]|uniref:Uncharacterized protein n=1 Tax=Candidozyma auris TaxID=498019 RepID=A0A0L0NXK0_CANAR|nr:hypothetical protein QG37_04634 [[Candida] auris]
MLISRSGIVERGRVQKNAQARNRTGGPTMATLDFTTKPLARKEKLRDGELNPGLPRDKR